MRRIATVSDSSAATTSRRGSSGRSPSIGSGVAAARSQYASSAANAPARVRSRSKVAHSLNEVGTPGSDTACPSPYRRPGVAEVLQKHAERHAVHDHVMDHHHEPALRVRPGIQPHQIDHPTTDRIQPSRRRRDLTVHHEVERRAAGVIAPSGTAATCAASLSVMSTRVISCAARGEPTGWTDKVQGEAPSVRARSRSCVASTASTTLSSCSAVIPAGVRTVIDWMNPSIDGPVAWSHSVIGVAGTSPTAPVVGPVVRGDLGHRGRQRGGGGMGEQVARPHHESRAPRLPDHADRDDAVTAQREEVLLGPHLLQAEDPREDLAESTFPRDPRLAHAHVTALSARLRPGTATRLRLRQSSAVHLAVGGDREVVQDDEGARHHVLGQPVGAPPP